MQQKVVTSDIFKGKKAGYAESVNQPFASSRLGKCAFWQESREASGGLSRENRQQVFLTGLVTTPAVLVPSLDDGDINPKVLPSVCYC